MKVLHIIPSVSPLRGGPSKAIIEMAQALMTENVDIEIATTNDDGPNELDVCLGKLTTYSDVPIRFFKRWSPPISALREFAFSYSFVSWLRKNIHDYDLIHVHAIFSFTSSYAMWLARKKGIPYIIRPIGQLETWSLSQSKGRKNLFMALFERKNLIEASAIHYTAASEQTQANHNIQELNPKAGVVVPLGINQAELIDDAKTQLRQTYSIAQDRVVFLYLSRLHKKKGLELLLESFAQIRKKNWSLIIAGEGEERYAKDLSQKIKDLDLTADCQMVGFVSGKEKDLLLQGSDFYALTSYSENFGISVLEALASGTKAIVSNEVALSTYIKSRQLGHVCELSTDAITQCLHSALEHSDYDSTSVRSQTLNDYGWPKMANQLKERYLSIKTNTKIDHR